MTNPMVSVVVCTYNRVSDLREVVDDLLAQTYDSYEILVVDNNSTDGTPHYVQEKIKTAPRLRYCLEMQQGKSFALNTSIQEAHGDIVAFMDDDCRVPPEWLEALVAAYCETEADAVGGRIKPRWNGRPSWLTLRLYHLGILPGTFDRGNSRCAVDWIPGGNMSFRRAVFDQVGGFDTDIGPVGNIKRYGEELAFCAGALRAGFEILYDPSVWLWHKVPRKRQSLSYVLHHAFGVGVANSLIQRPVNREAARAMHPLKVLINMFTGAGRLYGLALRRRTKSLLM